MIQLRPTPLTADDLTRTHAAAAPPLLPVLESQPPTPVADALPTEVQPTHLLHFEPLVAQSAGLDIPCDPEGHVGLDALGDKARNDYFFARALIGCLFARPTVKQAMPLMRA
ncbi:MAG: hypothetical protein ACT6S0_21625 [Roseateles sp.]|uniref:hypothetical protein n=1 Tax=Roseateles sp. TaxID=1971397 RepID=UPI0040362409